MTTAQRFGRWLLRAAQRFARWLAPVTAEGLWPSLPDAAGPLGDVTRASIEQALRAMYARHQFQETVSFHRSYRIRWAAFFVSLIASVAVVWAADTTFAKAASALPILATAILGLEASEPYTVRSGWHYTYKLRLHQLLLDLTDSNAQEIERRRLALQIEMGTAYPHWRLPREKAVETPSTQKGES
jgi:hypothetical protein